LNKPNKSRGGARPNSGPKKGAKYAKTLTKEAARDALRQIVLAEMRDLVGAQLANAKGLSYLVGRDKAGKFTRLTGKEAEKALAGSSDYVVIEVWEKDPSIAAFTDLMNRSLDKPREQEQVIEVRGTLEVVAARLETARKRKAAAA
jgi:hypothetical protein